jgi:hypothetical protein
VKRSHACDQCHSFRVFTPLTGTVNCVQTLKGITTLSATLTLTLTLILTMNCAQTLKGLRLVADLYDPVVLDNGSVPIDSGVSVLTAAEQAAVAGLIHPSARCALFERKLHSRMPLVPTHARFKRAGV